MDLTPYISSVVSFAVFAIGSYVAMKNANNDKFAALQAQNAEQMALIAALKEQVEKHNGVLERVYKLESDMGTAFKRIDELKEADIRLESKIERR